MAHSIIYDHFYMWGTCALHVLMATQNLNLVPYDRSTHFKWRQFIQSVTFGYASISKSTVRNI